MSRLSLIAAMDSNRLIGSDNRLPWHLSSDLQRFKALTLGKPIVMGRKTFDSLGKPLPGRRNIIISRNPGFDAKGCDVFTSLPAALSALVDTEETMIIGGAGIYELALPQVERMYLTIIEHSFDGDAWFPSYNQDDWQLVNEEKYDHSDERYTFGYRFITLERIKGEAISR